MRIGIIGGGIGGLSLANALAQQGLEFDLFESADPIRAVGAGILLGPNAIRLFDRIGLGDPIRKAGQEIDQALICNQRFQPLQTLDMDQIRKVYGSGSWLIHRGSLQKVLLDGLHPEKVHTGFRAESVDPSSGRVRFENGQERTFDLVVGADGIHSAIRISVFPERSTRNSGQICWRGVADFPLPEAFRRRILEAWSPAGRIGICDLGSDRVYWFAVATEADATLVRSEDKQREALRLFGHFPEPVTGLLEATPKEAIHRDVLADLPPQRNWYTDNVCLIGDAIHATTPNMGQGGAQAIEDAWYLAHFLSRNGYSIPQALKAFEAIRYPKVEAVVRRSWQIGKMAHWKNPVLRNLRNRLMKMTPTAVMTKQLGTIYNLAEPANQT